jgi:DUF971 family protein
MQAWPESIEWHVPSKTLRLTWQGEAEAQISASFLRESCRCANCEQARRQGQQQRFTDTTLDVLQISPVGIAGLQLRFSDGHDRGIYPWPYLKQLSEGAA